MTKEAAESMSEVWRRHGESIAGDPGQWEFQSRQLIRGAMLCMEAHRRAANAAACGDLSGEVAADLAVRNVAGFLAAQGIEVLLKAIALKHNSNLVHERGSAFYSHNIAVLCRLSGLAVNSDEVLLANKLTSLIEWAGRYPVPRWNKEETRAKYDLPSTSEDGHEVIDATLMPWSFDWSAVEVLIARLRASFFET
jgi:hypothetical protein